MSNVPFLKWAGGKRWLAPRLVAILETPLTSRLVEPFLGSGAAFFSLAPSNALLADTNEELIATFRGVRDNAEQIAKRLDSLKINKQVFTQMRTSRPRTDISRAVRLIYLNRTAFNGLYRVNRENQFNVPFGCKPGTRLSDPIILSAAGQALLQADLRCQDFRATLQSVKPATDIVYVDPPYTVKHDVNGFRRYNDNIFTWKDQVDLAKLLTDLARRGAKIVVSNAHHKEVRRLYPTEQFHSVALERATCMAASAFSRGVCLEWLLVSKSVIRSRSTLQRRLGA